MGTATAIDEEAQMELVKEVKVAAWLKDQVTQEIVRLLVFYPVSILQIFNICILELFIRPSNRHLSPILVGQHQEERSKCHPHDRT